LTAWIGLLIVRAKRIGRAIIRIFNPDFRKLDA
jgi:hypothetical protein